MIFAGLECWCRPLEGRGKARTNRQHLHSAGVRVLLGRVVLRRRLGELWRGGEAHELQWTSRNDVPLARLAVAYRWTSGAEWVLATVLPGSARSYTLRLPDALPVTDEFQTLVQALPAAGLRPLPSRAVRRWRFG